MKYKNRQHKRMVTETMASLLIPLENHVDVKTRECIQETLIILNETEVDTDTWGGSEGE